MRITDRIMDCDERGSAAAEFALVIPLFVLLTIGLYNLTFLLFAANSLHFAAERAARCTSLTPASCPVQVATPNLTSFGTSQYTGPTVSASFALNPAGTTCVNTVRAAGTFRFVTGLVNFDVPIRADACFPA
jgi:Flp pilus assembly protein TadG